MNLAVIRVAVPADGARLAAVLSGELGEDMYSEAGMLADIEFRGARVTAADGGAGIVGGAISRLLGAGDAPYYRAFGAGATAVFEREPVGSFEAVAVTAEARRGGLGTLLLEDALAWFRTEGCVAAVAISWITGRRGDSAGRFARAGFEPGPTVADFYLADSLRDGWACPVCGGPCHCAARFYQRNL